MDYCRKKLFGHRRFSDSIDKKENAFRPLLLNLPFSMAFVQEKRICTISPHKTLRESQKSMTNLPHIRLPVCYS